ncbi:MAG: OB-fold domain-containing protein [Pusillimonas sp.]
MDQIPRTPEVMHYLQAAQRGQLLVGYCAACQRHHHYPRPQCPHCFSPEATTRPSSGEATLYSFSVMRRSAQPYVIAFVRLSEGPTVMTNIVNCDIDAVHIGMPVRLVVPNPDDEWPLLMFEPHPDKALAVSTP